MSKQSSLNGSRLYFPIQTYKDELFFSLVDYRNSRFTSENPDKIIEFYDSFNNMDDLIEWMKERPRGAANIYEVEGDKEIILVIPTADFNGKYARECRENIFRGLHMIFVESGGMEDFYFNYAHNFNVGIKEALKHNSKWVVLSADDKYKIDDSQVLLNELRKRTDFQTVLFPFFFPKCSFEHIFRKLNLLGKIIRTVLSQGYLSKVSSNFAKISILAKFKVEINFGFPTYISNKFTTRVIRRYYGDIEMIIFPSNALKNDNNVAYFDENYINGMEDHDLLMRLSLSDFLIDRIGFKIGLYYNSTLGRSEARKFRQLIGPIYFQKKWLQSNYNSVFYRKSVRLTNKKYH